MNIFSKFCIFCVIILSITFIGCKKNSSKTIIVDAIKGSEIFIPGRTVEINVLWACDHEVTQAEYMEIMGFNPSECFENPFPGEKQKNRPVECVSWYDAIVYCNKRSLKEGLTPCYSLMDIDDPDSWGPVPTTDDNRWNTIICNFESNGYRLPTEAEWEWLARGGNTNNLEQTQYSGSDIIDEVAWYKDNCNSVSHEVMKKKPNSKGLYDMSGNVAEWCWDWYSKIMIETPSFGKPSGAARIIRGGNLGAFETFCSVTDRNIGEPWYRSCLIGFRVVRSLE